MKSVVSNGEFVQLMGNRSPRLKAMAKIRYEQDPHGRVSFEDLEELTSACQFSGSQQDVRWLQNLNTLAQSGKLQQLRKGELAWEDHVVEVKLLCAQKKIPFNLNDFVTVQESGKSGTIADYNVEKDEYVVVLNPFQILSLPASALVRGQTA